MRSIVFALVNAVWSTQGVLRGCWGGEGESSEAMGDWTYSTHWRSRER